METWFWLGIPLELMFIGCWAGIPLSLTLTRKNVEIGEKRAAIAAKASLAAALAQPAPPVTHQGAGPAYAGVLGGLQPPTDWTYHEPA